MNDMNIVFILIILIVLVALIGFFAASETAYLSLSKIKLRELVQAKKRCAKTALALRSDMDTLLTLVLVGINFFNTFAASLATALAVSIVGSSGVGIATIAITSLVTIFGEIIPKTAAVLHPDATALRFAPILRALEKIFFPIVWFFSRISRGTSFIVGKFWKDDGEDVTEEDIKMMIAVAAREGTLEEGESKMLTKVFQFSDLRVHDIMKHRSLVNAVSADSDYARVADIFLTTGCSRIPVFEHTPDGYKSVLFSSEKETKRSDFIRRKMSRALFVPETFTALEMLEDFKKAHTDFAVVLDEQGCTAGIVTTDDVMRVVFGRMTDENPTSDIAPEARITLVGKSEYIVPGDMKLDDVNAVLKLDLESEDFNTLGGWLLEKFGYLPSAGEAYIDGTTAYIVEDQARRRILSVRIKKGAVRIQKFNR